MKKDNTIKIIPQKFTLIELLVVIAIIAILASLLLPSLGKARDMAKQITCRSQLKQIAMLINMYTTDHNDQYPYGWTIPGVFWNNAISSLYSAPPKLFYCPKDRLTQADWKRGTDFRGRMSSYGYNFMALGMEQASYINPFNNGACPAEGFVARNSQIKNPSRLLLAVDTGRTDSSSTLYGGFQAGDGYCSSIPETFLWGQFLPWGRHNDMPNIGFADGHIDSKKLIEICSPDKAGSPSAINNYLHWGPVR